MVNKRSGGEDSTLLTQVQRGDLQAIALLYDRYASVVYSVALDILDDPALAEQIVSNIFLEVWRNPRRFIPIAGSLSPSLALVARMQAIKMGTDKPSSPLAFAPPYGLASPQRRNVTRDAARALIDNLPVERRIMLERIFFPGRNRSGNTELGKGSLKTEEGQGELVSTLADTGLEVLDLYSDPAFAQRQQHVRDVALQIEGMNRLASAFADSPATILQELVTAAIDLCGADSAGISVERTGGTDDNFWHWVATAGQYSGFVDAKLPRYPSACGLTLERGRPQIFRVTKRFFDLMGVQAPTVTDGMLLPWQAEETRGTIWIMAHGRTEAFDGEDCRMMQALANFAATGMRLQRQQRLLMEQARTTAAAAMAHTLAHQINNPLQGLMQTVFLVGRGGAESGVFAQQAMGDLIRLSDLVQQLLSPAGQLQDNQPRE
ncbi:MAG: sigma factor [Acidobacteriaceae bacterium]|jgi:DNA-directed RNA polymerase specialized sigma24 family protein